MNIWEEAFVAIGIGCVIMLVIGWMAICEGMRQMSSGKRCGDEVRLISRDVKGGTNAER